MKKTPSKKISPRPAEAAAHGTSGGRSMGEKERRAPAGSAPGQVLPASESVARFGGTLGAHAPAGALTVADDEDAVMGLQLTMQWEKAVGGVREQIIFGAMMLKLKAHLATGSARGASKASHDPTKTGTGLKGWLKKHAPKVTEGTAYRMMETAEGVQAICKLGKKVDLAELLDASTEGLPEKLGKMREKIEQLIEGKSQRQLLLQFNVGRRGGKTYERDGTKGKRHSIDIDDLAAEALDLWTPLLRDVRAEGIDRKSFVHLPDRGPVSRETLKGLVTDLAAALRQAERSAK